MLQPPKIVHKDKVIIVSPAGHVDVEYVTKTASILSSWGLQVEVSENALGKMGRFSGTVSQRLNDLQKAMNDREARIILCTRGGYGVIHLLEQLNFSKILENPKWLIGFSDITALHTLFQSNGLMSIHGPMTKDIAEGGNDDFAVKSLHSILNNEPLIYSIPIAPYYRIQNINKKGYSKGILFGGNLSVFCGMIGSEILKIPKNGILFIEDIGEEPYKVDRMIHQIKLAGIFDKISGLIVGQFSEYKEDEGMYNKLYKSIASVIEGYDFPVCYGFPIGHTKNNYPVAMGKISELEINENQIIFKQN